MAFFSYKQLATLTVRVSGAYTTHMRYTLQANSQVTRTRTYTRTHTHTHTHIHKDTHTHIHRVRTVEMTSFIYTHLTLREAAITRMTALCPVFEAIDP